MIESYLSKFKEAGIALQITLDIGKSITIHAFDSERKLHKVEDEDSLRSCLEQLGNLLL